MWKFGLHEAQAGIKIAGRNINKPYADDSILMAEKGKRKVKSLSRVWLFATPWTIAYQNPLSMVFSRQEYWSRLPLPSQGNSPTQGLNRVSRIIDRRFTVWATGQPSMAKSEEELKSLLVKVKEESEKVGLKFNIQKTKIMASSPTTSWKIDGETMETVTDFIFLGSKITADGN